MMKKMTTCFFIVFYVLNCHRSNLNSETNQSQIFGAIFNDVYAINLNKVLVSLSENSILPAYIDLEKETEELYKQAANYQQSSTLANLNSVRTQWQKAKSSVKRIEVLGFGPAVLPLDYLVNIDYYPRFALDTTKLETEELSALNTHAITITRVNGYGVIKRGFSAAEYLLFNNGNGISDPTSVNVSHLSNSRRIQYLLAVCGDLKNRSFAFNQEWQPSGNNYNKDFVQGTNTFSSQKQVLDEVVNQLIFLLSLLIDTKIGEPAGLSAKSGGKVDLNKLESKWSDHSIDDISSNMEGIKILYFGNYKVKSGNVSYGIHNYVRAINPLLDDKMKEQLMAIDQEITNIKSNSGTLRSSITQNPSAVSKLYYSIRNLRTTTSTELIVTLGATVGVSSNDGD